jgi:hypothetical protein
MIRYRFWITFNAAAALMALVNIAVSEQMRWFYMILFMVQACLVGAYLQMQRDAEQ